MDGFCFHSDLETYFDAVDAYSEYKEEQTGLLQAEIKYWKTLFERVKNDTDIFRDQRDELTIRINKR